VLNGGIIFNGLPAAVKDSVASRTIAAEQRAKEACTVYVWVWLPSALVTSIWIVVVAADKFTDGDGVPDWRSTFQSGKFCGQQDAVICIFASVFVGVATTVIFSVPGACTTL
jgi:hypothetical protein